MATGKTRKAWVTVSADLSFELFNDWGGRGFGDSVPGEVPKTVPSGDRTIDTKDCGFGVPAWRLM